MRKFLITILVALCALPAYSQPRSDVRANRIIADKALLPPVIDTSFIPDRIGHLVIRPQDTTLWVGLKTTAGGKHWYLFTDWIGAAPGGGGVSDTTDISNFYLKVRSLFSVTYPLAYSNGLTTLDTAIWHGVNFYNTLYPRLSGSYADPSWVTSLAWSKITGAPDFTTTSRFTDSLLAHTARFNSVTSALAGKFNLSDTLAAFAPYTRNTRFLDSLLAHTGRFNSVTSALAGKQATLVSGTNIKTINGNSLLEPGNLVISGGGSSDSSTFIIDSTYTALAVVIGPDTLRMRSFRWTKNGVLIAPVLNDSTGLINITIDSSDIANFSAKVRALLSATGPLTYSNGNISLDTSAGKWRSEAYYNTKYALIGSGGSVPSGNFGNIPVIRNGALVVPGTDSLDFDAGLNIKGQLSATNFLWAGNSLYPYLTLGGNDPMAYFGGTGAAWPSIGRSGGVLTLNGSNTAKRVNINSYLAGPVMLSLYDNGTSRSAAFLKTSIYTDTIIGGASDGSIMGNAYIGDSTSTGTGNSGHMFRAIARQGYNAASLNTFYSSVKMGNNNAAATQGHSVSFQHDAFKYGANTQDISYGAAFLADLIYGGAVNKRYGLAYWDANVNAAGGAKLGMQATIKIEKLKAAIGLNAHILADSSDYAQLDGNMYLGDSLHASGAKKAFHWFNGTAPTSSILGAIVWAEGGELKARDGGGNVTVLTDAPGTTYDPEALASVTAGAGFAVDTVVFTDSTLYGSFYTDQDSFYITKVIVVMKGQAGDTLGIRIAYNDTINVGGTYIDGGILAVNSRTTGNEFSISTNQGIPPGSWVWVKSPTVIAGKKPEYLSVTMVGYRKYIAP